MRITTTLILTFTTGAAQAHPGHIAEIAGHGHWIGIAALGAAIAIGLWKAAQDGKPAAEQADPDPEDAEDIDAEPQEA